MKIITIKKKAKVFAIVMFDNNVIKELIPKNTENIKLFKRLKDKNMQECITELEKEWKIRINVN